MTNKQQTVIVRAIGATVILAVLFFIPHIFVVILILAFVYEYFTSHSSTINKNDEITDYLTQTAEEMKALNLQLYDTSSPKRTQIAYAFRLMKTDYLKSATWNIKRKAVLKRDHYTCQQCQATGVLMDVHHMADYMLIPHEPITSLITLCRECHDNEHLLYGYPSTYEDYEEWDHKI